MDVYQAKHAGLRGVQHTTNRTFTLRPYKDPTQRMHSFRPITVLMTVSIQINRRREHEGHQCTT